MEISNYEEMIRQPPVSNHVMMRPEKINVRLCKGKTIRQNAIRPAAVQGGRCLLIHHKGQPCFG